MHGRRAVPVSENTVSHGRCFAEYGEMSRVPGILLTVNFCAVLLGAYFPTQFQTFLGHGWAGLFAIFAVGTLIALTRTTTELVYSSLMIAGFYYYLAKNNFPAAAPLVFRIGACQGTGLAGYCRGCAVRNCCAQKLAQCLLVPDSGRSVRTLATERTRQLRDVFHFRPEWNRADSILLNHCQVFSADWTDLWRGRPYFCASVV